MLSEGAARALCPEKAAGGSQRSSSDPGSATIGLQLHDGAAQPFRGCTVLVGFRPMISGSVKTHHPGLLGNRWRATRSWGRLGWTCGPHIEGWERPLWALEAQGSQGGLCSTRTCFARVQAKAMSLGLPSPPEQGPCGSVCQSGCWIHGQLETVGPSVRTEPEDV